MQLHSRREQSLVEQCQELQHLVEQREEEWVQREAGLRQAVRDKEQLLQRYLQSDAWLILSKGEWGGQVGWWAGRWGGGWAAVCGGWGGVGW